MHVANHCCIVAEAAVRRYDGHLATATEVLDRGARQRRGQPEQRRDDRLLRVRDVPGQADIVC